MGNIFKDFEVGLRYDLKGSTQGRTYLNDKQKPSDLKDVKTALKDNDFIKHVKNIELVEFQRDPDISQILTKKRSTLIEVLKADADFLGVCQIIDYSLLLGEIEGDAEELRDKIENEQDDNFYRGVYFTRSGKPYVLGVIDPLTGFNFMKSVEYGVKRLKWGTEMSCVPP